MAKTIEDAFTQLLGNLTPSSTESTAAASHRASIESSLKSAFGMTNFFRSGSFGFGTSVSGYSDVDYFAVVPAGKLSTNSSASLASFHQVLDNRFPRTGVTMDAPAIVVPFGQSPGERHEVIPAYTLRTQSAGAAALYGIANRAGGWMQSSPDAHAQWINAVDKRHGGRLKPLIRLIKAWKYYSAVPIRSFYLEARSAEYALTQQSLILKYDVHGVLRHLHQIGLADMADPGGLADPIYAGFTNEIAPALTAIENARNYAAVALTEENSGGMARAFDHWDRVFNGRFPAYY